MYIAYIHLFEVALSVKPQHAENRRGPAALRAAACLPLPGAGQRQQRAPTRAPPRVDREGPGGGGGAPEGGSLVFLSKRQSNMDLTVSVEGIVPSYVVREAASSLGS